MSNNKLSVCATGDLMLLKPFPEGYDVTPIAAEIAKADVRITNLESVVSDWDCFASTFCGGQWINTESTNLDEIDRYGFNLYGCANNHSMDFSFDGVLSTIRHLTEKGWNFAGIGRSLDEASSPVYMDVDEKRIAFISVTTTFIDAARAGNSRDEIPARPGVNPMRVKTIFYVTRDHYDALKEIAETTTINGERDNARKIGSLPPEEKDSINFGGSFFVVSQDGTEGKMTSCHTGDLKRLLSQIQEAKKRADYVFISVHSHQIRGTEYNEPDYFMVELAHKCIEVGGDAVVGGGTHQLKPIEIYQGKPIFYSLGNFVFQNHHVHKLPADFWDKYGYSETLSVSEGMAIKTQNGTVGLELDIHNYLSVIPLFEFEDHRLTALKLIPIELQFEGNPLVKGLPIIASSKAKKMIFDELNTISGKCGVVLKETPEGIDVMLN